MLLLGLDSDLTPVYAHFCVHADGFGVFFMSGFGFFTFTFEYIFVLSPTKSGVTRTSRS